MSDEAQAPKTDGTGSAWSEWAATMRRPQIWVPMAAATTVIAVVVGLVVANAGSDGSTDAAALPSSTATPTATTSSEPAPSATASSGAGSSAEPSPSASVSASASPEPSVEPSTEPSVAPVVYELPNLTVATEPLAPSYPELSGTSLARSIDWGDWTGELICSDDADKVKRSQVSNYWQEARDAYGRKKGEAAGTADVLRVGGGNADEYSLWSPDSSAFVTFAGGGYHRANADAVLLVTRDGSKVNLTSRAGGSADGWNTARWSADGTRVGFVMRKGDDSRWVVVADSAGKILGTVGPYEFLNGFDLSPDGTSVIIGKGARGSRTPVLAERGIDIVDLATGEASEIFGRVGFPSYSPDGSRIAYFGDPDYDGRYAAYVQDLSSGHVTQLGEQRYLQFDLDWNADWDRFAPVWSPDGTRVAATVPRAEDDAKMNVLVVAPDGTGGREYKVNSALRSVWSPDGEMLAAGKSGAVTVVRLSDGRSTWLRNRMALAWAPGNELVAYARVCGSRMWATVSIAPFEKTVTPVHAPTGWVANGWALVSPDGTRVAQQLYGEGATQAVFYLSKVA